MNDTVLLYVWFSTGTNGSFVVYIVYVVQYRNEWHSSVV